MTEPRCLYQCPDHHGVDVHTDTCRVRTISDRSYVCDGCRIELAKLVYDLRVEVIALETVNQTLEEANADLAGRLREIDHRDESHLMAMTDAVEQFHFAHHGTEHGLRVCPQDPCSGIYAVLPSAARKDGDDA